MNLLFFFLTNFVFFVFLFILFGFGLEDDAYKFVKYSIAFLLGMFAMELIA